MKTEVGKAQRNASSLKELVFGNTSRLLAATLALSSLSCSKKEPVQTTASPAAKVLAPLPALTSQKFEDLKSTLRAANIVISEKETQFNPDPKSKLIIILANKHTSDVDRVAENIDKMFLQTSPNDLRYAVVLEGCAGAPKSPEQVGPVKQLNEFRRSTRSLLKSATANSSNSTGTYKFSEFKIDIFRRETLFDGTYGDNLIIPGETQPQVNDSTARLLTSQWLINGILTADGNNVPMETAMSHSFPNHQIVKIGENMAPLVQDLRSVLGLYNQTPFTTNGAGRNLDLVLENANPVNLDGKDVTVLRRQDFVPVYEDINAELSQAQVIRNREILAQAEKVLETHVPVIDVLAEQVLEAPSYGIKPPHGHSLPKLCAKKGYSTIVIDGEKTALLRLKMIP